MSWTTPAELRAQVQRLWNRGDLLRAVVRPEAMEWPLRLRFGTPSSTELADRFEAVRDWLDALAGMAHLRIEWRERVHRVQGRQQVPAMVWIDKPADALALIGKGRAADEFVALWQRVEAAQPDLLAWLERHPLQALELARQWPRLLGVVAWLRAHPRPDVYLRQVDVAGIDSKFIEAHRGVLAQLFDRVLPADAVVSEATGSGQFARRYGFRDKPLRVRFRLLDPDLPSLPGCAGGADIALDMASFSRLALPLERVFITENEVNFLAFPDVPRAIVVFGAGYGWDALASASWLRLCALHYWGDIDTHGFAILDQLRGHFPHVASLLMDRATLLAHRTHWGEESSPARQALTRLTPEEAALHDELRGDRIQPRLRLEQERIGFHWLEAALANMRALPDAVASGVNAGSSAVPVPPGPAPAPD